MTAPLNLDTFETNIPTKICPTYNFQLFKVTVSNVDVYFFHYSVSVSLFMLILSVLGLKDEHTFILLLILFILYVFCWSKSLYFMKMAVLQKGKELDEE